MIENTPNTIIFSHTRSQSRLDIIRTRLALALTTGIPLLLSFLVPFNRLPQIGCMFYNITGLPGPFCGFTRSIWAISAGDWVYATVNCPLSWPLYAAWVGVFAWNAGRILFGIKTTRPSILHLNRVRANRAIGIVIALVLLNWIYRLSFGLT
jgi:hypothetical protein